MKKTKIYSFFLFIFLFNYCKGEDDCKYSIGTTKLSSISGVDTIYLNGKIDEIYKENSPIIKKTYESVNSEVLYLTEQLQNNSSFRTFDLTIQPIKNKSITADYSITKLDDSNDKRAIYSIDIYYTCKNIIDDNVIFRLKFETYNCRPFELYWKKFCRKDNFIHEVPKINLGLSKRQYDIIKDGVTNSKNNKIFSQYNNIKEGYLLNDDLLHFYISTNEESQVMNIRSIKIFPEDTYYVHPSIVGNLKEGGMVLNFEKDFYVFFNCLSDKRKKDTYTNFVIKIQFDNEQKINLYVTKICLANKTKIIVNFLKFIMFILILFAILLIVILVYIKLSKANIRFNYSKKYFEKVINFFNNRFGIDLRKKYDDILGEKNNLKKDDELSQINALKKEIFEEEDIEEDSFNLKIDTKMKNENTNEENTENENNMNDYGGV